MISSLARLGKIWSSSDRRPLSRTLTHTQALSSGGSLAGSALISSRDSMAGVALTRMTCGPGGSDDGRGSWSARERDGTDNHSRPSMLTVSVRSCALPGRKVDAQRRSCTTSSVPGVTADSLKGRRIRTLPSGDCIWHASRRLDCSPLSDVGNAGSELSSAGISWLVPQATATRRRHRKIQDMSTAHWRFRALQF